MGGYQILTPYFWCVLEPQRVNLYINLSFYVLREKQRRDMKDYAEREREREKLEKEIDRMSMKN